MSTTPPEPTTAQPPAIDPPAADPKPETDWQVEARKWEQRAKENKDAAKRLAEIEEANKTEVQKATDRATAAEQRATVAEQTALKTRIAAEMNVPIEVLHGDDEATVRAAAQKVLDWAGSNKKPAPKVTSLKSGSAADDTSGMTGKQRAAAALRAMQGGG